MFRCPLALILTLIPVCFAQPTGVTDARYAHLARGVNMNNWFEYGSPLIVTAADVTLLKTSGFTSIRLPLAPEYVLSHWVSASAAAANLANLDAAIDMFLNAGMAVMLDFHADPDYVAYYWANSAAPQELVSTWQTLAARYANRNPELLFFEIMNEPTSQWSQAQWDAEQLQVLAAIRKAAPQHTVLVAPTNWSGLDALLAMNPYPDPNLIYVVHNYDPMTFTHQGADWAGPTFAKLRNVPYPPYLPALQTLINQTTDSDVLSYLKGYQSSGWNADIIDWNVQLVAAWARKWGVRVVANEFGVLKPFAPPDSRARWIYDMQTAFAKQKIGWAMWDYQSGFDLVVGQPGSRTIDPNLAPALGLAPWTAPYPAPTGPVPAFTGLRSIQLGGVPVGNAYAESMTAADLNGDGLPDVVVAAANWPSLPEEPVQLFLNQGGGVMAPAAFLGPPPTQQFTDMIVTGNFDHSGHAGVFLPDQGHVPVNGTATQSKLILPVSADTYRDATANLPQQIVSAIGGAAGDVDGDGVDDLAVFYTGPNRPRAQILRNDGTGKFRVDPQALSARGDTAFTCGIFVPRRDRKPSDLVAVGWYGTSGRVFRNDGTGRFSGAGILPPAPANLSPATGGCAAIADLDGDGNADVLLGFQHAAANQPDFVQILINNGDGTFHDETDLRIGALPPSQGGLRRISLAAANNGKSRALILTLVGEAPVIRIDRGDGVFRTTSSWESSQGGAWVVAGADFDGDGLLDLAYGGGGTGPSVNARFGASPLASDGPAPAAVQHPFLFSAADAAAFSGAVSPGAWMSVFGLNFLPAGSANLSWSISGTSLPTSLGGVTVTVGDKPAAVSFLSPKQANVQVPDVPVSDYLRITLQSAAGNSTGSVLVTAAAPSLFEFGGGLPAATAADGALIGNPATVPGARPAHPGETIVLWGTGFGATTPASPAGILNTSASLANPATVLLDGKSIVPDYAGLTSVGLNQINFRIPDNAPAGALSLRVTVGAASTQGGVSLLIQ